MAKEIIVYVVLVIALGAQDSLAKTLLSEITYKSTYLITDSKMLFEKEHHERIIAVEHNMIPQVKKMVHGHKIARGKGVVIIHMVNTTVYNSVDADDSQYYWIYINNYIGGNHTYDLPLDKVIVFCREGNSWGASEGYGVGGKIAIRETELMNEISEKHPTSFKFPRFLTFSRPG